MSPTSPNASQTASPAAFSVQFVPGVDCVTVFVVANQYAILIFAPTAAGCLPSKVHWNNLQPYAFRTRMVPRELCERD